MLTEWLPKFDLIKVCCRPARLNFCPNYFRYSDLIGQSVGTVQVSDADLAYLYGCKEADLDLDAVAEEWLSAAPKCPILLITRGSEGTVAYRKSAPKLEVALDPVEVVDTVRWKPRRTQDYRCYASQIANERAGFP